MALVAGSHVSDWERYEAEGCPFSAEFPGEVGVKVDTLTASWGQVLQYEYSVMDDRNYFSVMCTAFPVSTSEIPNLEAVLDEASRRGAANAPDTFERMTVDGYSARRTTQRYETDDSVLVIYRLNLFSDRHQFSLGVSDWDGRDEDVERFFDSFDVNE